MSGVTIDRKSGNKQAVAEFQGQTMNETDLKTYFEKYVPSAQPGDDTIDRFIGDPGDGAPADEASLDIQFIMGVSPGIKTDFYLYDSQDFCKVSETRTAPALPPRHAHARLLPLLVRCRLQRADEAPLCSYHQDLKNWTTHMLSDDKAAWVHSVSYGMQSNMSTPSFGCTLDNVKAVDDDFAKLAAKGLSIIFASGDSGSGYAPQFCQNDLQVCATCVPSKNPCRSRGPLCAGLRHSATHSVLAWRVPPPPVEGHEAVRHQDDQVRPDGQVPEEDPVPW